MFEGVGVGWGGRGGLSFFFTSLGRTDVRIFYMRGARSRRWFRWWGRRGRWGGGEVGELKQRHGSGIYVLMCIPLPALDGIDV